MRVAPHRHGAPVARITGSNVFAMDGAVLASVDRRRQVKTKGSVSVATLRRCSLVDGDGDLRLEPDGSFSMKRPKESRFGLPAGATQEFQRACPTALLLYRLLPVFLELRAR